MYCGSNKTALMSQKAISEAFLSLLQEKDFSSISVSELCKCAGISRQTFYSLFQSKEDVICYELQKNYCFSVKEGCGCEQFSLRDLCHTYSSY
ncbi:MAG: TetR/AcrR family transcriptional regulator, partial [Eubacteriales bacterium]|nr:TetR/AcrR family transcriptional regulator [Eubacteriales bacterium]